MERYGETDDGHLVLTGGQENHPTVVRTVELCRRGGMAADLSHNWYITEVRVQPRTSNPNLVLLHYTTLVFSTAKMEILLLLKASVKVK